MMIETRNVWRGIAASLALALFVGNAVFVNNTARADVTWVLQPSSTLTFSAVVGTFSNNQFYELYNAVPQTDNGTGPFPGYNNSLVTNISGTMTSLTDPVVGDNFLASLNFGAKPSGITSANAQSVVQNSGNWLPNPVNGIVTPGVYGTPSPTNVAGTLVASGLYPANEVPDAGRISFQGINGDYYSPTAMPVDSTGHFDGTNMSAAGNVTININLNTNIQQGAISIPTTYSGGNQSGPVDSFIGRGTGTNSYQYVLHTSITSTTNFSADPFFSLLTTSESIVAVANLAKGDANFDGVVNGLDINAVAAHWLQSNVNHIGVGDVTGDGVVNGLDINMIAGNWLGHTPSLGGGSGTAVPEPSTWVLMGLGSIGMWVLRRRATR